MKFFLVLALLAVLGNGKSVLTFEKPPENVLTFERQPEAILDLYEMPGYAIESSPRISQPLITGGQLFLVIFIVGTFFGIWLLCELGLFVRRHFYRRDPPIIVSV